MKFRRQTIFILCAYLCLGVVSPVFGQTSLTTAFRYDSCYDDDSPETTGYEITIPLGFAYKGSSFFLSMETAYSSAHVDIGSDADSSLSSFTDTLLSASYAYTFANHPVGLILAIDVNLPTGEERLSEEQEIAELGESNDLFEVDNFGEGLNIGLSVGLMRQFDTLVLATQGAYIFNGEFDSTSDIEDDDLDPGDQILFLGLAEWQASSWLNLGITLSYSYYFPDKTEGEEDFRQGQQFVIEGNASVERDTIAFSASLQTAFSGKNEELVEDTLQEESENSNETDVFGSAVFTYSFSEKFNVLLQGDIRYYGESALKDDQTGLPYSGKRIRYALGPGVTYLLGNHLSCSGLFKVFMMDQDRDMFTENDVNYRGINLDIGVTYTF